MAVGQLKIELYNIGDSITTSLCENIYPRISQKYSDYVKRTIHMESEVMTLFCVRKPFVEE